MKRKNYYKILGVARNADQRAIQRAFRQLARRYHPDMNQGAARSSEKFHEINEAYEVLGDTTRRAKYDRDLREAERPATPARPPHRAPAPSSYRPNPQPAEPTGPIHSSQARPSDILTGATLFILIFACALLAAGLYEVVNWLAPESVTQMSTLNAQQGRTATINRQILLTALAVPSSTPAPVLLRSTLAPDVFNAEDPASGASCSIDLVNSEHTCHDIAQISLINGPASTGPYAGSVLLKIDLNTQRFDLTRAIFTVHYSAERTPQGLSVDISDSRSNEGQGGGELDPDRNAEVVINGTSLTVYGSSGDTQARLLQQESSFVGRGSTVQLEIGDQRLRWSNQEMAEQLLSRYLFALGGQASTATFPDYEIYAAFNRAIRFGTSERGSGVESVDILLLPPD